MREAYTELDQWAEVDAADRLDDVEEVDGADESDAELDDYATEDLADEGGDTADEFYEAIEDAFAESMDAADEDAFMARVRGTLQVRGMLYVQPIGRHAPPWRPGPARPRRLPAPGRPTPPPRELSLWRRLGLQALPAAERVVQAGATAGGGLLGGALGRQAGGALGGLLGPAGRVIGGVAGSALGGLGGRALGGWAGRRLTEWASPRIRRWLQDGMDAMDAFADLAADNLFAEEDFDEFAPMVAGLAGRYVVRAAAPPGAQRRQLGRQVMRATRQAAQVVVGRHGRQAMRSVPRIVRQALRDVAVRGGSAHAIPARIVRRARQLAARPAAVRRMSRPSPVARRIRTAAGFPRGRRLPSRVAAPADRGTTIVLDGPVQILRRR